MERQRPPRDLRFLIRSVTPFIIAALVVGAFVEYRQATVAVETRFNEKQAYLARQAADRLAEVFAEVRSFLMVLAHLVDGHCEHEPAGAARLDNGVRPGAGRDAPASTLLEKVLRGLRPHGAVAAWLQGSDGALRVGAGGSVTQLTLLARQIPTCHSAEDLCLDGPVLSTLSRCGRVLVATIRLGAAPEQTECSAAGSGLAAFGPAAGKQTGASAGIALDWGAMQEHLSRTTKLSPDTYAWVLDGLGRLIMHPEHREQLGHDALARDEGCARCHLSFEVHRRMSQGGSGTGRIQVIGGEPKLVAYTPLLAAGRHWSLAIATPARQVTERERGSLLSIFLLTGAIVLVMVGGAVLLDREASRRVRAASAFNQELSAKVAERTVEIQALYDRLARLQADHTRLERVAVAGEMAAIVAHEIRTPLNALSINAQMVSRKLRRGAKGADRQGALEALGTLEKEIQRINTLLEDHLLALVRHRPSRWEAVPLNQAVSEALRFMEPEATRSGVALQSEPGGDQPRVAADPAKLRQVLLNILLNAIQAMPEGGRVHVRTGQEDGCGTVWIRDTGPGIANVIGDDIEQVFRPFVTTKEDGTGLGLAICARLVKEMNGRIRVFSGAGEGATFVVSVPLSEPR